MQFNSILTITLVALVVHPPAVSTLAAQQTSETKRYSAEVVAKAERVLARANLRRVGKQIESTQAAGFAPTLSDLSQNKRELRRLHKNWKTAAAQVAVLRRDLNQTTSRYGELNLTLAQASDMKTADRNRLVGLINATGVQMRELAARRDQQKEVVSRQRAVLNQAEADFTASLLKLRERFDQLRAEVDQSLKERNTQIALQVMHANFETPTTVTGDSLLRNLDKRIERFEQDVFRESIPLEGSGGSLFVNVVVGDRSTRMVVDSGATLITLPAQIAAELGIIVPENAPKMKLILADGKSIPARGVTLPRVRVSDFTAENVEAAVLDTAAVNAESLLGMSFLGNFRFEISQADKTLKMWRVGTD